MFVANPRGDRRQASTDALLLRRSFYPRSTGLGGIVENVDGDGTPEEDLNRLDASMLHLGCGVTADGGLELAGPAVLERAQIAAGPEAGVRMIMARRVSRSSFRVHHHGVHQDR